VRFPLAYSTSSPELEALPLEILKLCPALVTFIYLVPCHRSLLQSLPPHITEFGGCITHSRYAERYPYTEFSIQGFEPFLEFVNTPRYRKNVMKLFVTMDFEEFTSVLLPEGMQHTESLLRDACLAAGVEYSDDADF